MPAIARRRTAGCGSARRGRARSRSRTCPGSRSRRSAVGRSTLRRSGLVSSAQTSSERGLARLEVAQQVLERQPGVDDVLDDQHVAALDRRVEVLEDPHDARGLRRRAVGGDGHEVDLARHVDLAHQVGEEEDRALEHADQQQVAAGVVARDLARRARARAAARSSAWTRISPIAASREHRQRILRPRPGGMRRRRAAARAEAQPRRRGPAARSAAADVERAALGAARAPRPCGGRSPGASPPAAPSASRCTTEPRAAPAAARASVASAGGSAGLGERGVDDARRAPPPRRAAARACAARSRSAAGWIARSAGSELVAHAVAREARRRRSRRPRARRARARRSRRPSPRA